MDVGLRIPMSGSLYKFVHEGVVLFSCCAWLFQTKIVVVFEKALVLMKLAECARNREEHTDICTAVEHNRQSTCWVDASTKSI
jgi:hypothetical protein